MSTSEAQDAARALYDSLIGGALQSLRATAHELQGASSAEREQRMTAALPSDSLLTPLLRNFLLGLSQAGMLDQLPRVVSAFERYAQQGGSTALSGEVVSAITLSSEQRAHILGDLRARYGEGLDLRFSVDPELIGGLIIRIGDQVLDNSLRARLSAVQRHMLSS